MFKMEIALFSDIQFDLKLAAAQMGKQANDMTVTVTCSQNTANITHLMTFTTDIKTQIYMLI